MDRMFFGNTAQQYLTALGIFAGGSAVTWLFGFFVLARLKKFAEKTDNTVDDFILSLVERTVKPGLYFAALFLAAGQLKLAEGVKTAGNKAGVVIITFFVIRALIMLAEYLVTGMMPKKETDTTRLQSVNGLTAIIKGVLWIIGILLVLDNLGYKVSTIAAGLGIGGVAVALAAQAVLGDLFSYVSIVFDRPFQAGDFIVIDGFMGTVENIGIKTTRIRSLDGEEIIFSNSNLTSSRIKNYKRMYSRRVVLSVGVVYGTKPAVLKKIPGIIKNIITGVKGTAFERAHLNDLEDSSISFEAVYSVEGNDYGKYMDIKQEINYKILEEFGVIGAELAYPSQTLYVKKAGK